MATTPEERYGSVDALIDDVDRFQTHRPVTALGFAPSYRLRKFMRRNRGWMVAAGFGVVLLIGLIHQYFQSNAAADLAQREAQVAAEVSDFLLSLFKAANPMANGGSEPSLKSLLDSGAQRLNDRDLEDPEIRARLAQTIGQAYSALAHLDDAERMLTLAKETQAELLGEDAPSTLKTAVILATNFNRQGRYDQAETLLRETLTAQEERYGIDAEVTIPTRNNLANAHSYQYELDEVLRLNHANARIARARYGLHHERTLDVLHSLAITHRLLGQNSAAEAIFEEIRGPHKALRGDRHPNQLGLLMNIADLYSAQLRNRDAAVLYEQAIELCADVLGNEHPTTNRARVNFANLKRTIGEHSEARVLYQAGIAGHQSQLGDVHPETLSAMANLAQLAVLEGSYVEAERLFESVEMGYADTFENSHINRLDLLEQRLALLHAKGQAEAAEAALTTLIARWKERFRDSVPTANERIRLAKLFLKAANPSAALVEAQAAIDQSDRVPPAHLRTLADTYAANNRNEEAVASLRHAIDRLHPQADQTRSKYQEVLQAMESDLMGQKN